MHVVIRQYGRWSAVAAIAMGAAACSQDMSTEPSAATTGHPMLAVGTAVIPSGATQIPIVSGSSIQFCGSNADLTGATNPSGACVNSFDLTAALAGTPGNPGWGAALPGSAWIGAQANANEYRVPTGTYAFQTTFTVPAGATGSGLNIAIKADNYAKIYLNGTLIGTHNPAGDNTGNFTTEQFFTGGNIISGVNTLRILLVNTRVHPNETDPSVLCPVVPSAFDYPGYDRAVCLNPSALDFVATAFYTPAVPRAYAFVVGDVTYDGVGDHQYFWGAQWWKNNKMSGAVAHGVAGFKGFAVLVNGSCGSTWQSLPGNSSNPPEDIGHIVTIIVTSTVVKSGNQYSGNIVRIAHVAQDGNYRDNPGHEGQGPVVDEVCPLTH